MLPIHTILHPTDFSDHSTHAFQLACALTRDYNARLVVLHVVVPPTVIYGEGILPPDPELLRREAQEQLAHLLAPQANVRAERRLAEGDPAAEVLSAAEEIGADLIVMGTHGRTGLGRLLMGSVAEEVMRHAPCPVLTTRLPATAWAASAAPVEEVAGA